MGADTGTRGLRSGVAAAAVPPWALLPEEPSRLLPLVLQQQQPLLLRHRLRASHLLHPASASGA